MAGLTELTIRDAGTMLVEQRVSSVELTEAIFEQINRTEPMVHAYAVVTRDSAMQAAARADKELAKTSMRRGPLHGIPVGIKDLIFTIEAPTEAGSDSMRGFQSKFDATVVRRLKDGGAIIVGKTHTHEYAYNQSLPPTRNVWDIEREPSGSSAGSGAAVAVRSAFGAIGTDTGGSIRGPAAAQGIVGLKPTFGRVSRYGVIPLSGSLDHVGPLTRTVDDCALMMNVIAGYDPLDSHSVNVPVPDYTTGLEHGLDGLRLGIVRDYFYDGVTPDYLDAVNAATSILATLGASIVELTIPELALVGGVFINTVVTDASAYHRTLLRKDPDGYHRRTRVMLEAGELIFGSDYVTAQRARRVLRDAVKGVFAEHRLDGLLAPSSTATARPIAGLSTDLFERANRHGLANLLGLPALSVPCGFSADGLPFGFQVYGRPFDEPTVLRVGAGYQGATEWHRRVPPTAQI
jgi:aspartyl-tRNA(Asn)/glutamyl-tRNA(Gln) amidotransferase subunit A